MEVLQSPAEAVCRASRRQGLLPAEARALIFVGGRDPRAVPALLASMPALQHAPLCIEERTLPVDAASSPDPAEWIAARLLQHRITPAHTLVVTCSGAPDSRFGAAARDLVVDDGKRFSVALAEAGESRRGFAQNWADAIAPSSPLHALRILLSQVAVGAGGRDVYRRILQSWIALENPARALEWLPLCQGQRAAELALRGDLEDEIEAAVARERNCLQHNLAHLGVAFPHLAAAVAAADSRGLDRVWLPANPWQLVASDAENPVRRADYPLLVRVAGTEVEEVNRPSSPIGFYEELRATGDVMTGHVCVGDVTRLDALANTLRNRLRVKAPNRSQQIYGLAPDVAALRRLLEVEDLRTLLDPAQIELHWGPKASDTLIEEFRSHPGRPLPRLRPAVSPSLEQRLCAVAEERLERANHFAAIVEREYASDRTAQVRAKLDRGEPLTLWSWTSRHTTVLQHTVRDLASGFESLGHRFDVLVESEDRELVDRGALEASLANSKPDIIVMLDHLRPEYGRLFPRTVPWVNWVLDDLPALHDPTVIAQLGPLDFCFSWGPSLARAFSAAGYPHSAVLPFATDVDRYGPGAAGPTDEAVAFATHLSIPPEPDFAPGINARLEAILSSMAQLPSGNEEAAPLAEAIAAECGVRASASQLAVLRFQVTAVSRHVDRLRVADAIVNAGLPLACYGRGWSDVPRFAPFARGLVAPGEDLRRMYARHNVVLHINTRCNMHPRVLEAMASGGFVLARSDGAFDRTAGGLADHFDLGREICLFEGETDMIGKIRQAVSDPRWRAGFVQSGRARVRQSHTFRQRAMRVLETVTSRVCQPGSGVEAEDAA